MLCISYRINELLVSCVLLSFFFAIICGSFIGNYSQDIFKNSSLFVLCSLNRKSSEESPPINIAAENMFFSFQNLMK